MNGVWGIAGTLAILIVLGGAIGVTDRRHFNPRWLLVAALLVLINDALLTRAYGLMPDIIGGSWNWQGKLLALGATLMIAALPAFGWQKCGFTLTQEARSIRAALPVAALYCAFFLIISLVFADDNASVEDIAFQLTMPGLEEEPFYRGILLFALDRAFTGRARILGVSWGWGAVLSCVLFGLTHAFGYANGGFNFDPITMALTALPAFIAVWIRLRTGSLLLPILLHNFGNAISLLI